VVVGLEVDVDTNAAGFTETPCYFAWSFGSLWHEDLGRPLSMEDLQLWFGLFQLLTFRSEHIHNPTQSGFTFRVWLPKFEMKRLIPQVAGELLALAQEQQLHVCWLGIQASKHPKEVNYGTA
jgi:hypothetical protein